MILFVRLIVLKETAAYFNIRGRYYLEKVIIDRYEKVVLFGKLLLRTVKFSNFYMQEC